MFMKEIVVIPINKLTGIGLSSSAHREDRTVTPLATKLFIPIAVALFVNG